MKQLLVAFSLFLAIHSYSQITVTIANMPVSGDTLRFSTALLDSSTFHCKMAFQYNQRPHVLRPQEVVRNH